MRVKHTVILILVVTQKETVVFLYFFVYEEIKRELRRLLISECRCNERLQDKTKGSTYVGKTVIRGGMKKKKIETRECECVI